MTEKQFKLLQFIRNCEVHFGKGPTFKEMRRHMGVSSNQAIEDFLNALELERYIRRTAKEKYRSLVTTRKGKTMGRLKDEQENNLITLATPYAFISNASSSAGGEPISEQQSLNVNIRFVKGGW